MEKERIVGILLIIVSIALVIVIYFNFFYYSNCKDSKCFSEAIVKCRRVSYIKDNTEMQLQYKITGEENNKCLVEVKLLKVKIGNVELEKLNGQEMICSLPLGVLINPEDNLKDCHGELREKIQEIIIERMHSQIVENLGSIKQSISKVL